MIKTRLADYTHEELVDMNNALESEGGIALQKLMQKAMQFPMNELIKTEEGGERNRGRIDIYTGFLSLRDQIKKEIKENDEEMQN